MLLFSTSEKERRRGGAPGLDMRRALEAEGLRVYNPRNKTAGRPGSPVHSLAALLSYLIDPVTIAPAGSGGRPVMVWASCGDAAKSAFAVTAPPAFPVAAAHATIQKEFRGSTAGIRAPDPATTDLLRYLDQIRADLADATEAHLAGRGRQPRLTLSGLVARLLTFPHFRDVGFTPALFREALFTRLLEANVAPTRRTRAALDQALAPTRDTDGKVVWPDEMWNFLNIFGPLLKESDLDDVEDDAFSEQCRRAAHLSPGQGPGVRPRLRRPDRPGTQRARRAPDHAVQRHTPCPTRWTRTASQHAATRKWPGWPWPTGNARSTWRSPGQRSA